MNKNPPNPTPRLETAMILVGFLRWVGRKNPSKHPTFCFLPEQGHTLTARVLGFLQVF